MLSTCVFLIIDRPIAKSVRGLLFKNMMEQLKLIKMYSLSFIFQKKTVENII